MTLPDSAAAAEERDDEDDAPDYDQRYRWEPYVHFNVLHRTGYLWQLQVYQDTHD